MNLVVAHNKDAHESDKNIIGRSFHHDKGRTFKIIRKGLVR